MKTTGSHRTISPKLKDSHNNFVLAYVAQGMQNATLAYSKAYPNAGQGTCEVGGSRLLKNPKVRQAIDTYKDSQEVYTKRTRTEHRAKLEAISDKAMEAEQYTAALRAEDGVARMDRLYEDDTQDGKASYTKTLNVFFNALNRTQANRIEEHSSQVIEVESNNIPENDSE